MPPSVPIVIIGANEKSSSPCFNGPPSDVVADGGGVSYKAGKKPLQTLTRIAQRTSCLVRLLLLAILLLLVLVSVLLAVIIRIDNSREKYPFGGPAISDVRPGLPPVTENPITTKKPEIKTCTSKGCVRAATNLLNAMNQSADPCSNFFEFACGSWNHLHPIPDDMASYGTFAFAREQVRLQLRVLLESNEISPSKSINMARTAYRICMNTHQLDQLHSSLLLTAVDELGGWPMLSGKEARSDFDLKEGNEKSHEFLTELLASSRKHYGTDIFFQIYVYADAKNTSRNTIFVDQGSLSLGRGSKDYYLNETMFSTQINAYKKFIKAGMKILASDAKITRDDEQMVTELEEMVKFEIEIAKIIVPEDDRRNNTRMYNKKSISELYGLLPQIDWLKYFTTIAPENMTDYFTNETQVIVTEIEYLKHAAELLSQSDARTIRNYALWRVAQSTMKFLDERFENIKQDLMRVITGQQMRSPRWKECTQVPATFLPLAAGAIYTREHFQLSDKYQAMEMIQNLRQSFGELVHENDWMDATTKEVAIEKAGKMINNIGYPEEILNNTQLDEKYERLTLAPQDTYFTLMKKAVLWMQEKEFFKLEKPFDKTEFDVSPAVVNAFYSPEKNAITFPAGILQPPFFSGEYPKVVNYGAIGAVIGHEITHGFDDQGSQYDKDGNLQNWWNEDSLNGFNTRKSCIVEQYGNYAVPHTSLRVNGKLTQGENIADNGGVKEAFRAYQKYIKSNGPEDRLPGLQEYTNEQIFFLSYAHFWCGHKKDAAAIQQVLTDEHSPELFRVIGVLSNLEEFSKAYDCPANSPLNPSKKCRVW
ncbi:unnamed protein product, partial [Mesorhabditis belari]|uniref:Uncharacterized protein n=1 Tax=Mesorhabditis belari TaxID=2138241 RepID=A0AAF3FHU6_9BILA